MAISTRCAHLGHLQLPLLVAALLAAFFLVSAQELLENKNRTNVQAEVEVGKSGELQALLKPAEDNISTVQHPLVTKVHRFSQACRMLLFEMCEHLNMVLGRLSSSTGVLGFRPLPVGGKCFQSGAYAAH